VSDDQEDLHRLVQASLQSIDRHIGSVEQLPIERAYKKELSSILSGIRSALAAAQPILAHLSQVQNLVIRPVQVGVDRAFKESNRWGVIGLQVSIFSLALSTALAVYPYLFSAPEAANRDSAMTATCMTPRVDHILKNVDIRDDGTYLAGRCLQHVIATVGGIDVPVTALSDALIQINPAHARIRLEGPEIIRVQNYSHTIYEGAIRYVLTRPDPEFPNRLKILTDSTEASGSEISFPNDLPVAKIITTAELDWTLGGDPEYFGEQNEVTDERESTFNLPTSLKVSKSARYFAVVDAVGIGPDRGGTTARKWQAHTSFTFNSASYDLAEYWPYWDYARATRYTARFVIPLSTPPSIGSKNIFSFRSGRYAAEDGSRHTDNLLIERLSIAVVNHD
jgi:hypothetical protein